MPAVGPSPISTRSLRESSARTQLVMEDQYTGEPMTTASDDSSISDRARKSSSGPLSEPAWCSTVQSGTSEML